MEKPDCYKCKHRGIVPSKSGFRNTGDSNTGFRNSGFGNTGDWNSGDFNSGFFNTDEPTVRIFNKDSELKRHEMCFPNYFYFHVDIKVGYKKSFVKSFMNAEKEDVEKTIGLPNFDYGLFEEISGITKGMIEKVLGDVK